MLEIKKRIEAQQYVEAADYLLDIIEIANHDATEITELVRAYVSSAVCVRDQGNYVDSLKMMESIWNNHKEFFLCLEILVISVHLIKDGERFRVFEKTIPREYQSHPHILLFIAGGSFLTGDLMRAADLLQRVSPESVHDIPSFDAFRRQLIFNLNGAASDLLINVSAAARDERVHYIARDLQIKRYVTFLKGIDSFAAFEFALISGILYPAADVKIPTDLISDIVLEFQRQIPEDERNVVLFRLLVAFKFVEPADSLAKILLDTKFVHNPDFIKQLFKLSELNGMAKWRLVAIATGQDLLELNLDEFNWRHPNANVQHKELSARMLSLRGAGEEEFKKLHLLPKGGYSFHVGRADREHVFIGMFGQCRFSNYIFPRLAQKLNEETWPLRQDGVAFSYGIATWDRGGSRGLFDTDSVHFLLQHLPVELHESVMRLNCKSVADVKRHLPNLVKFCASHADLDSHITADYLTSSLWPEIEADIWSDTDFMSSIGQRVANKFEGNFHLVNQARMWNRISALRALAERAESEKGLPITRYLLLRSDLVINGASLISNLLSLAKRCGTNFLMGDNDPHANFIEGLGDRIMFCDRQAFSRITSGQDLFLNVIDDDGSMKPYLSRCHAHQFLETILFEQDTRLNRLPWELTKHEIYRGRLTMEQVKPHLDDDLHSDGRSLEHLGVLCNA